MLTTAFLVKGGQQQQQACRKLTPSYRQHYKESLSAYPVTQPQTHHDLKYFAVWNFQKGKVQGREIKI